MTIASAISVHPVAAQATGEVIADLLERIEAPIATAFVFVTPAFVGALSDVVGATESILSPDVIVSVVSGGILSGNNEVESGPGIAIWASDSLSTGAFHISPDDTEMAIDRKIKHINSHSPLVVLADPLSGAAFKALDALERANHRGKLCGGVLAHGDGIGSTRLGIGNEISGNGAVIIAFERDEFEIAVSRGSTPLSGPLCITEVRGDRIISFDHQPALEVVKGLLEQVGESERSRAARNLSVETGLHSAAILGGDRSNSSVAVSFPLGAGEMATINLSSPERASEDLRRSVHGGASDGALLFTCIDRGEAYFGSPHRDADVVSESLGSTAVAGLFCSARIARLGGQATLLGDGVVTAIFGRSRYY